MGTIKYQGQRINVPDAINGKALKHTLNIPENRTPYVTDLDGKSKLVGDGDKLYVTDGMQANHVPYTEKG